MEQKLKGKMADFFGTRVSQIGSGGYIELFSNTQAVVERVKFILSYNECEIKLALPDYSVAFRGEGLYIQSLDGDVAIVQGVIVAVEFSTL